MVTWDKPSVHTSFGLRYILKIDPGYRDIIVPIANNDTTYCDATKCTYTDTGLAAGSLHNYQLQVWADYDICDPITELSAATAGNVNIMTHNCTISLGINGLPGVTSLDWYTGSTLPTVNWGSTYIAAGTTCAVSNNLPNFSGSKDCSSEATRSVSLGDMSGLSDGSYVTNLQYGSNCQSNNITITKHSSFSIDANPPSIDLVAVGSPVGKTGIKSSASTINVLRSSGFTDSVSVSASNILISGVTRGTVSLIPLGTDQYGLQVKSTDYNNPLPDGSYNVVVTGVSSPPSSSTFTKTVVLKVRTISPGYRE